MIDLIGYWGTVSLIVFTLTVPYLLVFQELSKGFFKRVFESEVASDAFVKKFIYFGDSGGLSLFGRTIIPKEPEHEDIVVGFVIIGGILNIFSWALVWIQEETYGQMMIGYTHSLSSFVAPLVSWVFLILIIYYGGSYLGNRLFKLSTKLSNITDKLDKTGSES